MNARAMLEDPRQAYLVLHAEPEFDFANAVAARRIGKGRLVVVMSPFRLAPHTPTCCCPLRHSRKRPARS